MDKATPRINAGMRQRFIGNTVRMVGKVVKINGNMAIIEASDQTQVQVTLNQDAQPKDSYIEIIGKVNDDLSLTAFSISNYGNDVDMTANESLIKIAQQFPDVFGTA